jgi:hypothetical protein
MSLCKQDRPDLIILHGRDQGGGALVQGRQQHQFLSFQKYLNLRKIPGHDPLPGRRSRPAPALKGRIVAGFSLALVIALSVYLLMSASRAGSKPLPACGSWPCSRPISVH